MNKSRVSIAGVLLSFLFVSCQPVIDNARLSERGEVAIVEGTARPNAIDKDSFYPDRREGRYFEWRGGAKTASFREGLRIRYNFQNSALVGEYALGNVGVLNYGFLGFGSLSGRIENGVLEGSVIMEGDGCIYSVFGSVTKERILAYAEPTNCLDREPQEWDLRPG